MVSARPPARPARLARLLTFTTAAAALLTGAARASAAIDLIQAATDATSGPTFGPVGAAAGNGGLRLQTNASVSDPSGITISALGFYDGPNNSTKTSITGTVGDGLSESHALSLYNLDTGADLRDVSVPAGTGATLSNGFRYASLTAPLFVPANTHLAVVAYTLDGAGTTTNRTPTIDPYGDFATFNGSGSVSNYSFNSKTAYYVFDGLTSGLPSSSTSPGSANEVFAAASFEFVSGNATPEPASLGLLAAGAGLLVLRRRRA